MDWKVIYLPYLADCDMAYAFHKLSHYGDEWELYAMWPAPRNRGAQ